MLASEFAKNAPGKLIKTPEGWLSFIPDPLPRSLELSSSTNALLIEAVYALGLLEGSFQGKTQDKLRFLVHGVLRQEALLSNRIEGTQATLEDLALAELQTDPDNSRGVIDIQNYLAALELARTKDSPISVRMFKELHAVIMKGTSEKNRRPGDFRATSVRIGGVDGHSARFVPPPAGPALTNGIADLEKFVNEPVDEGKMHTLTRAALFHYQLETLHPFLDGNGRLGRALVPIYLSRQGYNTRWALVVSPYFSKHRDAYYEALKSVSTSSAWNRWISFFFSAIKEEAFRILALSVALELLHLESVEKVETIQPERRKAPENVLRVLSLAFESPYLNATHVQQKLAISAPTARRALQTLERAGILKEETGNKWGRIWIAPKVLDLLREA